MKTILILGQNSLHGAIGKRLPGSFIPDQYLSANLFFDGIFDSETRPNEPLSPNMSQKLFHFDLRRKLVCSNNFFKFENWCVTPEFYNDISWAFHQPSLSIYLLSNPSTSLPIGFSRRSSKSHCKSLSNMKKQQRRTNVWDFSSASSAPFWKISNTIQSTTSSYDDLTWNRLLFGFKSRGNLQNYGWMWISIWIDFAWGQVLDACTWVLARGSLLVQGVTHRWRSDRGVAEQWLVKCWSCKAYLYRSGNHRRTVTKY